MKNSFMFLVLLSLLSIEVSAQTYGLDNADPSVFSKFRIPETDLSSLWFNTNLNFLSNKTSNYGNGYDYFNSNFDYSLAPQYYFLRESDDRYLSLNVMADGSYQRYRGNEYTVFSPNDYYITTTDNVDIAASEDYRTYSSGSDMYFSVGSTDQFSAHSGYRDSRNVDSTRSTFYSGQKNQMYTVSFGIGLGKMRNVTSVVSALRFQDRLKQLNLLSNDLNEKTIEDLAEQFYRQGYYSNIHVRPDRFFWDDVEKTLSADGVSLSGLNQYAESYIREVPGELRFSRNEGVVVGVDLKFSYNSNYYSGFLHPISEQLFTLGETYVNYSHQMDLNSQINFDISLNGGPNLIKNPGIKQEYVFNAGAGYNYELTDRLVAFIDDGFGLTFQNMGIQGKHLSNYLNFGLNYFVEDNKIGRAHV